MENDPQPKKKKYSKSVVIALWLGGIVLFFLTLLTIGSWYLETKFPDKLKTMVSEKSNGQYQLEFDKMTLSLLKGQVHLQNVHLSVDTQAYFDHFSDSSGNYLIQLDAKKLDVSGIKILNYLRTKKVVIGDVFLDQPDVVLYQMRDTLKVDSVEKNLYEQIPDLLKGMKMNSLQVNELTYAKREKGSVKDSVNKLSGVSFSVHKIAIDSSALENPNVTWFSEDIKVNINQMSYMLASGLYSLKVEKLVMSTKEKSVDVEAFKVIPQYKELEFSKRLGKAGDRYNVILPLLEARGIDFKKIEQEGKVFLKSLSMSNAQAIIFHNRKMPSDGKDAIQNAPHLALKRLKTPILIDTVKATNFEIHYRELTPESNRVGDVFFTNMNGVIKNITNDSSALKKNHWITSTFDMKFLDLAKINVDLNLNLLSKVGEFNYKGNLGAANAVNYNQILTPLAMVKVEKGYISKVVFDIKANRYGSNGTVQMLYKDLKVDVLVKEDSGKLGKDGLMSFLANKLLITPSNPLPGLPVRVSHFTYPHSSKRSFFNLMWKSIFAGIKGIVIESKAQKKKDKVLLKENKRAERKQKKETKKAEKAEK